MARLSNTEFRGKVRYISSERATCGVLRPPSITCLAAAKRNSCVYFRSGPDFLTGSPQGQDNKPRGVRFSGARSPIQAPGGIS